MQKQLGGTRLGSGSRLRVEMENFSRSTHDESRVFRSTMAPGTLVPCFTQLGLFGDTYDIDIESIVKTLPTTGPLFGSFKFQVDIFQVPIRLYNALLHMNVNNIGLQMDKVYFPIMELNYFNTRTGLPVKGMFQQDSLMAYLGVRGGGKSTTSTAQTAMMEKNALFLLAYWDIYKQYYANKQEEIGMFISPNVINGWVADEVNISWESNGISSTISSDGHLHTPIALPTGENWEIMSFNVDGYGNSNMDLTFRSGTSATGVNEIVLAAGALGECEEGSGFLNIRNTYGSNLNGYTLIGVSVNEGTTTSDAINISQFPLSNIDDMRLQVLQHSRNSPFMIKQSSLAPYGDCVGQVNGNRGLIPNNNFTMNGLAIKTYQSDLFNNWLSTEWVTGANAIAELTSVDVSTGALSMDSLNFAKKLFKMLNRVAVSGGSYEDWMEAVNGQSVARRTETPIYCGGMSREIIFQEVVSSVKESDNNPLGTLGGKGEQSRERKGGKVYVKCTEPCVIIGVASLTPRVDYSQGNKWWTNLKNMDELHKPDMDGIGFQQLITEQMVASDVNNNETLRQLTFKSAGFQPSWINYTTAYNETYGGFADENKYMYMTLNRRYEVKNTGEIMDLTTYIDPTKYNAIFADTELDAQNFWVQLGFDVQSRKIMSAKLMPNV